VEGIAAFALDMTRGKYRRPDSYFYTEVNMEEYTKLEFNKAMADMSGIAVIVSGMHGVPFYELDVIREDWDNGIKLYDPYNDANQLLMVAQDFGALKAASDFVGMDDYVKFKDCVRDVLWERAKELELVKSVAEAEAEHVRLIMAYADKITYACDKEIQDEYVQEMMHHCRQHDNEN